MARHGENIRKRKDGRWEARYQAFDAEKSRKIYRSVYGSSYAAVKEKRATALHKSQNPDNARPCTSVRFAQAAEEWLAEIADKRKYSTYVKYRNIYKNHLEAISGSCLLSDIPKCELQVKIFDHLSNRELSESIRRSICCTAKQILAFAGEKYSVCIPALKLPEIKHTPKQPQILSRDEQSRLLAVIGDSDVFKTNACGSAANTRTGDHKAGVDVKETACGEGKPAAYEASAKTKTGDYEACADAKETACGEGKAADCVTSAGAKAAILLCLFTGMRLGELCALKWSDIDCINRTVTVNRTVQRISATGHISKTILMETSPKSESSKRTIPLTDPVLERLRKLKGDKPYIFGEDKPLDPRTMQQRFKRLLKEAGVDDRNFHTLRHVFATNCIENGMDVKALSEILGHADVKITLNRYVHPTMDTKRQQLGILSDYYGQICGQVA